MGQTCLSARHLYQTSVREADPQPYTFLDVDYLVCVLVRLINIRMLW